MATSDNVWPGSGEDSGPRLSVAAVARRLGMAPSTLRTWDRRYGLGPTFHQAGSHRRYSPVDLERLVVMRRLTLEGVQPAEAARIAKSAPPRPRAVPPPRAPTASPPPPGSTSAVSGPFRSRSRRLIGPSRPAGVVGLPIADPPPRDRPSDPSPRTGTVPSLISIGSVKAPGVAMLSGAVVLPAAGSTADPGLFPPLTAPERDAAQARGLARAAMALDGPEVWRILDQSLTLEGVLATWNRLAVPVLQAIGERWWTTGEMIEVEHLFSETLIDALRSVVFRCLPPRRPNPVLLACLEKERHTLPLHALSAALAERGVNTRMLGAGLPASSLVKAVRRTGPAVVFLYAQLSAGEQELLAQLRRQRPAPQLILGGPGWSLQPSGVVRVVRSLEGALNVALSAVGD